LQAAPCHPPARSARNTFKFPRMQITILYDNTAHLKTLRADWGFSCLIRSKGKNILFDTGARGSILLNNMRAMGIRPESIDLVFISHPHWDHTGGLDEFLKRHPARVYLPADCPAPPGAADIVRIREKARISETFFSTGALDDFEQSLVVVEPKTAVLVVGCSHPGVGRILSEAAKIGRVRALIGGLHGFSEFKRIENLDFICPAHCTRYARRIQNLYAQKFISGGAGKIIEL